MKKNCFKGRFCANIIKCHSQKFLLGISHIRFRKWAKLFKQAGDPRQNSSGMTALFMPPHLPCGHPLPQGARETTGGFTLIELLVVVLIIGILAAVAVPQYQVAVEKSRAVEAISNLKSLMQAEETFYYANGQYANQLDQLDIIISPQTSHFALDISTLGEGRWVYTNSEKKYSIVASGIHRDTHYSTVVQGKIYCCNTGSPYLCKHIGREKVKETIACADAYWVD